MKRRQFLTGAAVAGAAAAASSFPAPAIASGKRELKMVMAWPKNSPGLGMQGQNIGKRITELTDGKLTVTVYGGGELVPPFQSFDAVSSGAADLYHAAEYYWPGKHKAYNFFTTVPFGLIGIETFGWIHHGGGQELWDELSADFNIKPFVAACTGVQMLGWFRNEINSLDDMRGLKYRIPGIAGEVFREVGVAVVNLPVAEIYPALASGAIDAAEWVGPWHDLQFGFHRITKHYYRPGVHEPGTFGSVGVNKQLYDSLPRDQQLAIQMACEAEAQITSAEFNARNMQALRTLINEHGVMLRTLPQEVVVELGNMTHKVLTEMADEDPFTKRVYESFLKYRADAIEWAKIGEHAFMDARLLPYNFG